MTTAANKNRREQRSSEGPYINFTNFWNGDVDRFLIIVCAEFRLLYNAEVDRVDLVSNLNLQVSGNCVNDNMARLQIDSG